MITKALLYCTKNNSALFYSVLDRKYMIGKDKPNDRFPNRLNGHVVAVCDIEVGTILNYGLARRSEIWMGELLKKSCLTMEQLNKYAPHKDYDDNDYIYAIHIKNLKVFDEPHKLGERFEFDNTEFTTPKQAPQNMCYCMFTNSIALETAAFISIQPQWLVKILNGEKTIEVRKKVLRDMLCQD